MHLEFTDEQRLLAESAERFFSDNYDLPKRRARMEAPDGFDRELWAQMAELGWLMLRLPERLDGLDGGPVECAVVMQALGNGLGLEPVAWSAIVGAAALDRGGSTDTELAAKLATGEALFTLAYTEPRSRASLHRVATTATADGDDFVLSGHKVIPGAAAGGAAAAVAVVAAAEGGEAADAAAAHLDRAVGYDKENH